jgi:hypothetical protein
MHRAFSAAEALRPPEDWPQPRPGWGRPPEPRRGAAGAGRTRDEAWEGVSRQAGPALPDEESPFAQEGPPPE